MEIQKWNKKDCIFDGVLDADYMDRDFCDVYYIAGHGYCVLNRAPQYSLYKRLSIPEIQDVYVVPDYRGRGVATALIRYCETLSEADMIGISVPMGQDFGPAQRLYHKLGYAPDGQGATYLREYVPMGTTVKMDDNLCLMLIKDLQADKR